MSDKGNPNDIGAVMTPSGWVVTGKGTTTFSSLKPTEDVSVEAMNKAWLDFARDPDLVNRRAPALGGSPSGGTVTLNNDPITVTVGDPVGYRRAPAKAEGE